mgnify:CR=1 FL=1
MLKNIDKQKVLKLKDAVTYQKVQVVFLILTQNEALSVTLFLIKEEISSHKSGGDAFVTCLDGESIVMPIWLPYAVYGKRTI